MLIIAHRGLLEGPDSKLQNRPEQIDKALDLNFDAEVDLWVTTKSRKPKFWLGHDEPEYEIDMSWLKMRYNRLWIHCKNIAAIEEINGSFLNYFWHETDTLTMTSMNYIWAYPGKQPIRNSIAVMPELLNDDISMAKGICTDYPLRYRNAVQ